MKKFFKYILMSAVAIGGLSMTSCNDDENSLSRKVLASVDVLEYKVAPEEPQVIYVVSDGDWTAEAPEWVTVTPSSGHAGKTDVTITVNDNLRDGTPDNPRKANILFKGRNLESISTIIIRQDGDKFRDPIDYSIAGLTEVEDETVVRLPNMIITTLTSKGFVVTDGTSCINVLNETTETRAENSYAPGDVVSVVGDKFTDSNRIIYLIAGRIASEGKDAIPENTPSDITNSLDNIGLDNYTLVTITGDYDGSAISVNNQKNKVYMINPSADLGVDKLGGHKLAVTGYLYGVAAPVVNIIPSKVEDLGLNEVIYFFDDFSWLEPWVAVGNGTRAGDTVGTANSEANTPQLQTPKVDGVSGFDAVIAKGYDFVYAGHPKVSGAVKGSAKDCTYIQDGYLKFCKTSYHSGLVLPAVKDIPEGETLQLDFNWCPMIQGSGNFDTTKIVVVISNNGEEQQIEVPDHTLIDKGEMKWQKAEISLEGYTINENTKIIIRNCDEQFPDSPNKDKGTTKRFFLDNIKIKKAK